MSKILVERFLGVGKWTPQNINKLNKSIISNNSKYDNISSKLGASIVNNQGEDQAEYMDALDSNRKAIAAKVAKLNIATNAVKTDDENTAARMISDAKFQKKNANKVNPRTKALYLDKLSGKIDGTNLDYRDDEVEKIKARFKKISNDETADKETVTESYSNEELVVMLQESTENFASLNEEQVADLIDTLGYEYLEETAQWIKKVGEGAKKVAKGVGTAAVIGGFMISQALGAGKIAASSRQAYRDNIAEVQNHTADAKAHTATAAGAHAHRLEHLDAGLAYEDGEESASKELEATETIEAEKDNVLAGEDSAKTKSLKTHYKSGAHKTSAEMAAGLGAVALAAKRGLKRKGKGDKLAKHNNETIQNLQQRLAAATKRNTSARG